MLNHHRLLAQPPQTFVDLFLKERLVDFQKTGTNFMCSVLKNVLEI